ncbi:MAG: 5'/3'-nucleotidase SurE, partial [Spirochaetes bacterium]|nr:5'/3'-nucleotidase SurE [Spirochaetota bacterium]
MRILLTNDDGISAKGINLLYESLSRKHDVYVIAPNEEKSGCSSAITMKSQLKIETLSEKKFAVHGFTADCVNIGLKGNIIPKVDMVVSGINHGPNCGDDIYFSGTVAGARIGYIYGLSSIAISIDSYSETPNLSDT